MHPSCIIFGMECRPRRVTKRRRTVEKESRPIFLQNALKVNAGPCSTVAQRSIIPLARPSVTCLAQEDMVRAGEDELKVR